MPCLREGKEAQTCCTLPSDLENTELKYVCVLHMMTEDVERCDLFFLGGVENEVYQSGPQQETDGILKIGGFQ